MGLWKGLKQGAKALVEGAGPQRFDAGGKQLHCTHCGHEEFIKGSTLMNTFGMTVMNLDWANKEATTLM